MTNTTPTTVTYMHESGISPGMLREVFQGCVGQRAGDVHRGAKWHLDCPTAVGLDVFLVDEAGARRLAFSDIWPASTFDLQVAPLVEAGTIVKVEALPSGTHAEVEITDGRELDY